MIVSIFGQFILNLDFEVA